MLLLGSSNEEDKVSSRPVLYFTALELPLLPIIAGVLEECKKDCGRGCDVSTRPAVLPQRKDCSETRSYDGLYKSNAADDGRGCGTQPGPW